MTLQGFLNLGGFGGGDAPLGEESGAGVVLFPAEPIVFRSRADKAAYAWAVLVRDMRAPTAGFRPMRDHLVSAVRLAAR